MKNFVLGITFVLMAALLAPMAGAQDITRGSIGGVVRDATGAVVADATVTLTSPYGEKKTKTNSLGEYVFSNLNVGTDYAVSVEKPGFSVAKTAGLTVSLNSRV